MKQMNKEEKIRTIRRMLVELTMESEFHGGFNELDQTESEFLRNVLLNYVSHEGLDKFMEKIEETSHSGVNRKSAMTRQDIKESLKLRNERIMAGMTKLKEKGDLCKSCETVPAMIGYDVCYVCKSY